MGVTVGYTRDREEFGSLISHSLVDTHNLTAPETYCSISGLFPLLQIGTFNSQDTGDAGMLQIEDIMTFSVRKASDFLQPY